MPAKTHTMHGRDHLTGGADPIPGLLVDTGTQPYPDIVTGISDLVAYWRMGAASGNQPDTSGYLTPKDLVYTAGSTVGTYDVTGADPLVASGDDDGAFRFNYNGSGTAGSEGTRFAVSDAAGTPRWGFAGRLPFSACLFVKPSSSWSITATAPVPLVSTQSYSGGGFYGWGLSLYPPGSGFGSGTGQVVFVSRCDGTSTYDYITLTGIPDVPADTWTHIAYTYDGTTQRLYYDGIIVAAEASSLNISSQNEIFIGRGTQWNGNNRFFFGDLDEIAIYKKALTAEEIASLAPATSSAGTYIPYSRIDAKGDLLAGTAADTLSRLAVGTNNHVLTADSAQSTGIKWAAVPGGGMVADTLWDAKGDLAVASAADTGARLAVGTDGHVLTADSAQSTGIKWAAAAGGSGNVELAYTEKTSGTAINATTNAGSNTIVTAASLTMSGSQKIMIDYYCGFVFIGAGATSSVTFVLYDAVGGGAAASIGELGNLFVAVAASASLPVYLSRVLTPSAAAHVYSIRAYRNNADATIAASTGGGSARMPTFIRITTA